MAPLQGQHVLAIYALDTSPELVNDALSGLSPKKKKKEAHRTLALSPIDDNVNASL
jgi:hypothetical protein